MSLVEIRDLTVEYVKGKERFRAIDAISLSLSEGETLAVVGESGCGKTTLARAVLGLQPYTGEIKIEGRRVEGATPRQSEQVGMVWQDPYASLDPLWTIERSIREPGEIARRNVPVDELLTKVGLDPVMKSRFPHQFSGGQRQRVAIARAIGLNPKLVICDEPTAALDLSVQAQVLNLLKDIQDETRCSYLFISHDLATVSFLADRIAVMYLGKIVEIGPADEVMQRPKHPYTKLLLDSMLSHERIGLLPTASQGEIAPRTEQGCTFRPRCNRAQEACSVKQPELSELNAVHTVACYHPVP